MSTTRNLLYITFWMAFVLAALGLVMDFVPGAECGWFLMVAALSAAGLFIPKIMVRAAAVLLLILALSWAGHGYRRGIEYRQRLAAHHELHN